MYFEKQSRRLRITMYVLAVPGIALAAYGAFALIFTGGLRTAEAQTNPFLDQRINRIEQQLNSFDSRINRLEQYSRTPIIASTVPRADDTESRLLISRVETLQLRVGELECAAVKLDERTLTDAARKARRQTAVTVTDICRSSVNETLKLSARP